jgi:hypothetical protein
MDSAEKISKVFAPSGSTDGLSKSKDAKSGIDKTLQERGARYGKFVEHSLAAQNLKEVMRAYCVGTWDKLADDQKEALEMIAHKIARILSGDPNYADNWHDIVGYAKLVDDRLSKGAAQ